MGMKMALDVVMADKSVLVGCVIHWAYFRMEVVSY